MRQLFSRISKVRAGFFSSPSTAYPLWLFVLFCGLLIYYSFYYVPKRQAVILDEHFQDLGSAGDLLTFMIRGDLQIVATQAERALDPHYQGAETAGELNQANQVSFYKDCNSDAHAPEGISFRVISDQGKQVFRTQYHLRDQHRKAYADYHVCVDRQVEGLVALAMGNSTAELDGIALTTGDGEVVYESAQRGFRLANIGTLLESAFEPKEEASAPIRELVRPAEQKLDSLLPGGGNAKVPGYTTSESDLTGRADWKNVRYTTLLDANLGKTSYKLLVQPVLLPFYTYTGASQEYPTTSHLTLVGVVSSEALNKAAHKLPPVRFALFISCFVLLLLIFWPGLKLWFMGPAEGFQVKEILFFTISMLFALSLLTLVMLYETRRTDNSLIDGHIRAIGEDIDRNLAEDLRSGTALLEAASAKQEGFHPAFRRAGAKQPEETPSNCNQGKHVGGRNDKKLESQCNVLAKYWSTPSASEPDILSSTIQKHPWFDQMFWVDTKGDQVAKWSVKESVTPPVQLKEYPFFHDVAIKEPWIVNPTENCRESQPGARTGSFLPAPLYSPNTGEYGSLVVQPDKAEPHNLRVLFSALVSVNAPVLPPDFGFAIVDDNGLVRFHSAAIRNSREHILERLHPSEDLQHAMAGDDVWFDAIYRDRPVRVNARPFRYIAGSPWILVVFHDTSERDKFLIHVLLLVLLCFGLYYLYLAALFAVVYVLRPLIRIENSPHTAPWYVPSPKKFPSIVVTYLFLFIIIAVHRILLVGTDVNRLWAWQIMMPPLMAVLVWFAFIWAPVPWGKSWPDISRSTAKFTMLVVVALMVFIVAGLPAITFFTFCYLDARVPYRQAAQIQLQQSLELRDSSIREYLNRVTQKPPKLDEQRRNDCLDRYDYAWFNPSNHLKEDSKGNYTYNNASLTKVDGAPSCRAGEDPFLCALRSPFRESTQMAKWKWQVYRSHAATNATPAATPSEPDVSGDWLLMTGQTAAGAAILTPLPPAPKASSFINPISCFLLILVTMVLFGYRFGWDHPGQDLFPDATKPKNGENKLLLVYPRRDPKIRLSGPNFQRYSLPELIAQPTLSLGKEKFVVIRDFQLGVQEPPLQERTLEILETLVADETKTTILLSTVDPVYWVENYRDIPRKLRGGNDWHLYTRWVTVINAFTKEQDNFADSDEQPPEHNESEEPLHIFQHDDGQVGLGSSSQAAATATYVRDRNVREECHLLWNTCTPREKLVLWQLADQGVSNPKNNDALDQLVRRGLIRHEEPRFVIRDPDFHKFVKTGLPPREVEFLYPAKADTAWRGLRWVLFYSFLALVLVLAFNSADLWESGFVSIAAVGGTAVPLIKAAYDAFKSFKHFGVTNG